VVVFNGGGIAEGEKSRRFSGFTELSLVDDCAKLAALTCLAPLAEYVLALSIGCGWGEGTLVST
jgi:hypothetical protein